ncbi:MAG: tetratricopeptide repeat protein, partial [Acidobacteriota bacterium]
MNSLPLFAKLSLTAAVALLAAAPAATQSTTSQPAPPQPAVPQSMSPQPADPKQEDQPAPGGGRDVTLVRMPVPDTSALEPAVAELVAEKQKGLEQALLDPPSAESLAESFADLGYLYHAHELWPAAEAAYLNANRLAPSNPYWPYALGRAHQQQSDLEPARRWLGESLRIAPKNPAGLVYLAEILAQENRPDEAEALLRKALEFLPASPAVLSGLGELALAQGRHDEAISHLDLALQQVPEANRLHYPLAMAYRAKGDLEKAREHLGKHGTVGVKPPDPVQAAIDERRTGERVFLLEGRRAFKVGRYSEAAEAFTKAVAADPSSQRARVNLGSALAMAGDLDAGEAQLRKVLEEDPKNGGAHFNLGLIAERRNDLEGAVVAYRKAIDLDPADSQAQTQLGRTLRRLGRPDEAAPVLKELASGNSADPLAQLDYGAVLAELGRYAEAKDHLVTAYRSMPGEGLLAHALARLLAASPEA